MTTSKERQEWREFADSMGSEVSTDSIQFRLAKMVWELVDELNDNVAASTAYSAHLSEIEVVLQRAGVATYNPDTPIVDDVRALVAERDKERVMANGLRDYLAKADQRLNKANAELNIIMAERDEWRAAAYAASADHAKAMTERSAAEAERDEWREAATDHANTISTLRKDRDAANAERDDAIAERDIAQHCANVWQKDAIHAKDNAAGWECRYEGLEAALRICIEELRK